MKNVQRLAATVLLSAAFYTCARAAEVTGTQTPTTTEIQSLQDPDGTPYVISHPGKPPPSRAEIDAARKQDQENEKNKDWLVRSYEQQLEQRNAKQGVSNDNNLYYRIATDKNLSNVAGLSLLEPSPQSTTTALRTGAGTASGNSLSLRTDTSVSSKANPTSTSLLKPLITPLGGADAAGLHNFYGGTPSAPAAVSRPNTSQTSDFDMPGKVAADNDPLSKASLTFDSLPDETPLPQKSSRSSVSSGMLPTATNAEHIQKMNDAATTAPGSIKTVKAVPVSSLQLKFANEPPPPTKLTMPNPIRQGIASPYSILDH